MKCLLSPDVRQLATTSSDKTIKLWNLDGFSLDRTLTGKDLSCLCMMKPRLQAGPLCSLQIDSHAHQSHKRAVAAAYIQSVTSLIVQTVLRRLL